MLSYPGFVPFDLYRRGHFAHHRDELGPDEPDMDLYPGYPITRDSLRRKLRARRRRHLRLEEPQGPVPGAAAERSRPVALRILGAQVGDRWRSFTAFGRPELYLLWLAPG